MHPNFFSSIVSILSGSLRLIRFVLSLVAGVIFFSTIAFVSIYFYFARDLPDIKSLSVYKPTAISQVFDDQGKQIGEFWTECRIFLPYEKIPKKIIDAFIASEDSRFWEHKGVDIRSIVRAFVANLKAGEITQGGSTITQQITRSLLLTTERTITRKVKEAILATRIERTLSKEQILTLYLNQIFLGNRAYGVAAAARNYFHKDVNELSNAEIAIIAGMPSAPSYLSPIHHPEDARVRQEHVLGRMLEEKIINQNEYIIALNEKLTVYTAGIDKDFTPPEARYFVEHIRRMVKDKYGDDILYRKGVKIYSTVNMAMQKAAYNALRHGLEKLDKRQGWRGAIDHVSPEDIEKRANSIAKEILQKQNSGVITLPVQKVNENSLKINFDPETFYKAIVTGFKDKDTEVIVGNVSGIIPRQNLKWARSFDTNRSNYDNGDFVSDPRNILKVGDVVLVKHLDNNVFSLEQEPLVQGALFSADPHTAFVKAMIGGYEFSKSEFDRTTQALRQPGSSFKPFVYAAALDKGYKYNTNIMDSPVTYVVGREVWSPKNYGGGFKGPTPFRNALVFSRNVPTVKILSDIGTHYLTAYERKLGITTPIHKYLSMALGANGVYLSEMVPAYMTFLNEGVYKSPIYITKIEDLNGDILEENRPIITNYGETKAGEFITKPLVAKDIELKHDLFDIEKQWIERDKLKLSDEDLKTLYGTRIPEGHVITPQTAFLMVNLLKEVVEGGTGTRLKALGKPAAGKTGTTNDETDTWFNGFVPDLAAGVWVGFDEIRPLGKGETGGRTAAPIFLEYMQEATKGMEVKDFIPPADFPMDKIATLTGGSALIESRIGLEIAAERGGVDRAGEFFEEDLEYKGDFPDESPSPSKAPSKRAVENDLEF